MIANLIQGSKKSRILGHKIGREISIEEAAQVSGGGQTMTCKFDKEGHCLPGTLTSTKDNDL